ncbi:hypothetical protein MXB_4118 [Myxobolus squamalis]|nr:hypothetical protein MXB_4118 [Myxobolus squamalis]
MIIIPTSLAFKKTRPANLEKFLSDFIRDNYSEEILKEHIAAIKSLENLRNIALCKPLEISEQCLHLDMVRS